MKYLLIKQIIAGLSFDFSYLDEGLNYIFFDRKRYINDKPILKVIRNNNL